jgi:hypothetical protein
VHSTEDIDALGAPVNLLQGGTHAEADFLAGDDQGVGPGADLVTVPAAMNRVEFQQVGLTGGIALDLVDVDDLKLRTPPARAEAQFAHATKTIDANTNRHAVFSG